jgi:membrane fusion protein, heavy metal efflux system
LIVPAEGVQTIDGEGVSFIRTGEDTFEMRPVRKGRETDEQIEILKGLHEGEEVVVKGSFILKSEFMKGEMGGHDH